MKKKAHRATNRNARLVTRNHDNYVVTETRKRDDDLSVQVITTELCETNVTVADGDSQITLSPSNVRTIVRALSKHYNRNWW